MQNTKTFVKIAAVLITACLIIPTAWAQDAQTQPAGDLTITVVDQAGKPVRGVLVGTKRRESDPSNEVLWHDMPSPLVRWGGNAMRAVPLATDAQGRVSFRGDDVFKPWHQSRAIYAQDPAGGRAALMRVTPKDLGNELPLRLEPACLISADFRCMALDDRGIPMIETHSYLDWKDIQIVLGHNSNQKRCAFIVPPGEYTLRLQGFGQGIPLPNAGGESSHKGIPTKVIRKTITIEPGQRHLDLGTIDFELSKQGLMVGEPAPPLGKIALWKNTEPFTLEDHRGKVVVLLFWSRGCSGTSADVAWLGGIHEHLKDRGLEVLAIHEADPEISDRVDFDRLAQPLIDEEAAENAGGVFPDYTSGKVPIAVAGGEGLGDAYTAYHVTAWPTGILIDRQGRVRHIFQHYLDYKVIERALEQGVKAR